MIFDKFIIKVKFLSFIFIYRNGVCPLSGKYNVEVYPDKFADREIGKYIVECKFKEQGCVWRNRIRDFDVSIIAD